jgi:hypothetical protein
MKHKPLLFFLCGAVLFGAVGTIVFGQDQTAKQSGTTPGAPAATPVVGNEIKPMNEAMPTGTRIHPMFIDVMALRGLKKPSGTGGIRNSSGNSGNVGMSATVDAFATEVQAGADKPSLEQTLPLWTFRVHSSRDGDKFSGAMVGKDPFRNPGKTTVPTKVIPLIIKTNNVAVSFDPNTGLFTTQPGDNTFNPTRPDNVCLSAPNNVPAKLVQQSPIFKEAKFVFGGTEVGTTQYLDAFQRANFWNALEGDRDSYHVLLGPVQFLDPITLEVPSVYGLALTNGQLLGPPPFCTPMGIVDINWFDTYVTGTLIPSLGEDVDPTNLPIFLVYNVVWASPVDNLFTCCILGYHGTTGFPIPTQTYSPADFDSTGFFTLNATPLDTIVLSHEVGEWINDPMVSNPTPPWGHTGQVGGCQANLEVGDPLSGTDIPSITMPNGFTYHLQELAFFSWFFGAPSIGVNGWFSDNGKFLVDAGPPCH